MTLTATRTDTGETVCAFGVENPKEEFQHFLDHLRCPISGLPVRPVRNHFRRRVERVRAHFRHVGKFAWPDDVFVDSEYGSRESLHESMAHMKGKICFLENGYKVFPELKSELGQLEQRVLIEGTGRYRIADILFSLSQDEAVAVEIQLSRISVEDLRQRSLDYLRSGVEVVWCFGDEAKTAENIQCHYDTLGYEPTFIGYRKYEDELSIPLNNSSRGL